MYPYITTAISISEVLATEGDKSATKSGTAWRDGDTCALGTSGSGDTEAGGDTTRDEAIPIGKS